MSLSTPFIERPVATTLLTIGVALAGLFAFGKLPVAPLPQVDFPTISVFAQMPGASPETMATTVATPLERHLGGIGDVNEITSSSTVGSTRITLQFGLSRNIDGAARDVQAAINAARVDLPSSLRTNPTYRKVNPADAPILILSLTSDTETRGQMYDAASTILQPALSQIEGIGQVQIGGAAAPAVRVEINPTTLRGRRPAFPALHQRSGEQAGGLPAARHRLPQWRGGAAHRCRHRRGGPRKPAQCRPRRRQAGSPGDPLPPARRQHHRHGRSGLRAGAAAERLAGERHRPQYHDGPQHHDPQLVARCRDHAGDRDRAGDPRRVRVPARRARHPDTERCSTGLADRHLRRDVSVGLQPRQFVADGADDLDRVCRRRRDRRLGKRHPPYRGRHEPAQSRSARRRRGRVHRLVDEPVADRGVRPDPLYGRARRSALPRIRDDPVGGDPDLARGVADHDADDVRLHPDPSSATAAFPLVCRQRAGVRGDAGLLRPHADAGPATLGDRLGYPRSDDRPQHLSVHSDPEGLVPTAGHRPHGRRDPGRSEHLVSVDEAEAGGVPARIPLSPASSASPAAARPIPALCSRP